MGFRWDNLVCQKESEIRCSRCKSEYYCSRECQVKHWKQHKEFCNLMVASQKEEDDTSNDEKVAADEENDVKMADDSSRKNDFIQAVIDRADVDKEEMKQLVTDLGG